MNDAVLLPRAKKILETIKANELQKYNLWRKREDYFLVITYPPLTEMKKISQSFIKKVEKPKKIILYVHFPFCTGKCSYCHYLSFANITERVKEKYLKALRQELLIYLSSLPSSQVLSVYFGGGTPSILNEEQINSLFGFVFGNINLANNAEITFESSPETLTLQKLKLLKSLGVTRISMGVQSFNDSVLKLCRRRHNERIAKEKIELIKKAGFKNFNIDLIFGLPKQTIKSWLSSLNEAINLEIPSVTIYNLRIKKATSFYNRNLKEFPSEKESLLMHILAFEKFKTSSYLQGPVDWFIKKKKYLHQYQVNMWEKGEEMIGLGLGSYSLLDNYQYYNYPYFDKYFNLIKKGKLPIWKGEKLSRKSILIRNLVLGLKTKINKESFFKKYSLRIKNLFENKLKLLKKLDLIKETERFIKLTYKGRLFADEVSRFFFEEKYQGYRKKKKTERTIWSDFLSRNEG